MPKITTGSIINPNSIGNLLKVLPNPSKTLANKGDIVELYHAVASQPDIFSATQNYADAIADMDFIFADKFLQEYFIKTNILNPLVTYAAAARDYGIAIMEIVEYGDFNGKTMPLKLDLSPIEKFHFDTARQLAQKATPATFRFNPGASGDIFPKNNPYTKVSGAKEAINALDMKDTKTNIQAHTIKTYNNGGSLQEHHLLQQKKYKDSDYKSVTSVANTFAQHGHQATIMPTIHINDQKYKEVYHQLMGTKYEGKSPDFHINGNFYEYKSVKSFTANKLTDILRKAEKQSSHIIIDKIPVSDSEIIKSVKYLNQQGKDIQEVWMYDKENKTITQVFKKQKH